jgi:Zn-dependent protease
MIKLVLLLFGAAKAGKLGLTAISMLVSLVLYASIWGWRYAAGFILLLFVHEMGHVIAARQRNLAVGAPAFIPFMGAFIAMRDTPHDAETEAHVAIGGPLLGSVAAFLVYFIGLQTGDKMLLAVSYSGFVLNLFNLLPVQPLDGGRIVGILGPRMWLIGVPALIALFVYRPSPMLIVIAFMAVPGFVRAIRGVTPDPAYFAVSAAKKWEYGIMYLGLAGALAVMAYDVHDMLQSGYR